MKRLLFILLLFPAVVFAPEPEYFVVTAREPVCIFGVTDPFLRAVMHFESDFDANAVNPYTGARGVLQILPIMINEVNKFSNVRYTWNDAFDPYKSIEIWNKVMAKKNPEYFPDKAIRIWFGTGRQHDGMRWEDYYNIVMN